MKKQSETVRLLKYEEERLNLEFKKTYYMFLNSILKDIEKGSAVAAEQYIMLEDMWKKFNQNKHVEK